MGQDAPPPPEHPLLAGMQQVEAGLELLLAADCWSLPTSELCEYLDRVATAEGCAFPGCDRPAAWTEGHHITYWSQGGSTALDNLVLLCLPHHHTVHHQGWTVTLDEGGLPSFRPPPWIDPDQTPRQHHRYGLRQLQHDLSRRGPPQD